MCPLFLYKIMPPLSWVKNLRLYQHSLLFVLIGASFLLFYWIFLLVKSGHFLFLEIALFIRGVGFTLILLGVLELLLLLLFSRGRYTLSTKIVALDETCWGNISYTALILSIIIYCAGLLPA